jgi:KDO2-lipid IV(A) lauroyltransferase
MDSTEVEGVDWLTSVPLGQPVIIAGAHTGNPELAIRALSRFTDRQFVALVQPLEARAFAREMLALRNAGQLKFVEADRTGLKVALATLRGGGILGVLADRDLSGSGVCVPLAGRCIRLPRGPWELAQRTGAVILPAFAARIHGRRMRVEVHRPICVATGVHRERAVQRAAEGWAVTFEQFLRANPGQWSVMEDYWRLHACQS